MSDVQRFFGIDPDYQITSVWRHVYLKTKWVLTSDNQLLYDQKSEFFLRPPHLISDREISDRMMSLFHRKFYILKRMDS